MKTRTDSPFAKLTEEQCHNLLALSDSMAVENLVEVVAAAPEPIKCSIPAMRRFLRRIREENLINDVEESQESIEKLAQQGEDKKVREAALSAARQRMFQDALATNNREALMEIFTTLNEEKARERQQELDERKVMVAEENARLGWKKLEYDRSLAAAQLLPKVWAILTDAKMEPQDRVARAQQCLVKDAGRLLAVTEVPQIAAVQVGEVANPTGT